MRLLVLGKKPVRRRKGRALRKKNDHLLGGRKEEKNGMALDAVKGR